MSDRKRFDNWSPLVPKVDQVVQIQFDKQDAFEAPVMGRRTEDGETYMIWFDWPWTDGKLVLDITPVASARGMVDQAADRKPYWRTVPHAPHEKRQGVKLFFMD